MLTMGSIIAFILGSSFVFILLCVAENKGYIRRINKFGNPQIGGRSSPPDGWKPPTGITQAGQTPREPCGLPKRLETYRQQLQQQEQDNTPKKFSDPDE